MASDRPRGRAIRAAAARDLERAGEEDAPVEVVDYDPRWPTRFAAERDRLAPLLPDAQVEHIGSTAVPGLAGKPIIDLMALVEDLNAPIATLTDAGGYQYPEEFNAMLSEAPQQSGITR